LIFLDYDRHVVVEGFDPALGTKIYTTVSGGLAYDDPQTGKVYHLVINQEPFIFHILTTISFAQSNDESIT
jgi:hypothetical protein